MRLIFAGFLASTCLCTATAAAQSHPCPTEHASPKLVEIDAGTRLAFIRDELRDNARHARVWSAGWGLFGVGIASESVALAITSDTSHDRIIWLAQGLPALGFPGLMLIDPLKVMSDDRDLEKVIEDDARRDPCATLARAEGFLEEDAADERKKTNLFAHALGVLANIASSAVIVIGTGDWGAAVLNGVGGTAVSEINLWTLPTGAASALDRYRAGDLFAHATTSQAVRARGLTLTISW